MASTITASAVLGSVFVSWLIYEVWTIVYNIYLGPLRQYPGPKWAAASRIPLTFHRLRGDDVYWIRDLHLKYGEVVRVAPNNVSYTNGQAWKDIYNRFTGVSYGVKLGQFQKDLPFYGRSSSGFPDLLRANDQDHARVRRNLSNVFSAASLREQGGIIRRHVDFLAQKLDEIAGKGVECDMVKMLNCTTFDIMGDLTAGESLNCLANQEYHPQVAYIFRVFRMMSAFQEAQHYPMLIALFRWIRPSSGSMARDAHFAFAKERVDRRLARPDARPDIIGLTIKAKEEYQLSKEELYGNMRLFMTAGTETSATLLSGLIYYLLRNPRETATLTKEIRRTFSSADEIDPDVLAKMPYLNACLEEGLRMYPPLPSFLPRLLPSGGATICGGYVPENTVVYVHQFATYYSPANFKNPRDFKPERFLDDPEYASDDRSCLQPFSFGPRNCIGKNLAYLEMRLILALVLWHFDLSAGVEQIDWARQKAYFLWDRKPLPVSLARVKASE